MTTHLLTGFLAGVLSTLILSIFILIKKSKQSFNEGQTTGESAKEKHFEQIMDLMKKDFEKWSNEKKETIQKLEAQNKELLTVSQTLQIDNTKMKTQINEQLKINEEKEHLLKDSQSKLKEQFELLAHQIFEDKKQQFSKQNIHQLEQTLKPFKEQIDSFKKQVQNTHEKDLEGRIELKSEIQHLQKLNTQISEDAKKLSTALKGQVKTQGIWGEMILKKVLEISGLVEGREFRTQKSLSNDGKRFQPDVIVYLPDQRQVIIDSKVSINAYERYHSAINPDNQQTALKDLNLSIKNHINNLSSKQYQNLDSLHSLDFVFLFIPIEGAYILALQNDPAILDHAFKKQIIIVTPSTLLVSLRTIENMWRFERQNHNALKIAEKGKVLYDKFVGFVTDIDDIGKKLEQTQKSYSQAMNKLKNGRGNLMNTAESLIDLGVKSQKKLN